MSERDAVRAGGGRERCLRAERDRENAGRALCQRGDPARIAFRDEDASTAAAATVVLVVVVAAAATAPPEEHGRPRRRSAAAAAARAREIN